MVGPHVISLQVKQAVESVIEGDVTMEADTIADFEDGGKDHEPKNAASCTS